MNRMSTFRVGTIDITVFIDLDLSEQAEVFAVAGKGKQTLNGIRKHLVGHSGRAEYPRSLTS